MNRVIAEISPEQARFISAFYDAKSNPDINNTQILAEATGSLNGDTFAFTVDLPELGTARSIRELDLEKVRRIAGGPEAFIEGRPFIPVRDNLGDFERVTGEIKFSYCNVFSRDSQRGAGITDVTLPLSAIKRVGVVFQTELDIKEKPKSKLYTDRNPRQVGNPNAARLIS